MDRFRVIYAFVDDLGEVFYVGECRDFYWRLAKHRRELEDRQHLRVYRRIKEIKAAGGTVWIQVLATVPDDLVYARILEALIIADIGLVDDGGTLLNSRRSSIGPAGYIEESIRRISNAAKRQWQRDRDVIIAAQNKGKADPEAKERHRLAHVGLKRTPEALAKQSATMKRLYAEGRHGSISEDNIRKRSERMKAHWADPVYKEAHRQKLREAQKKAWAEGRYKARNTSAGDKHSKAIMASRQSKENV